MSAFGGAPTIQLIVDRSAADAALADLRAQKVNIPVTFGNAGNGLGPQAQGPSSSIAAPPTNSTYSSPANDVARQLSQPIPLSVDVRGAMRQIDSIRDYAQQTLANLNLGDTGGGSPGARSRSRGPEDSQISEYRSLYQQTTRRLAREDRFDTRQDNADFAEYVRGNRQQDRNQRNSDAADVARVRQQESEQEQIQRIRQQAELIGQSPRERLATLRQRLSQAAPDSLEQAQLEQQVAQARAATETPLGRLGQIASGYYAFRAVVGELTAGRENDIRQGTVTNDRQFIEAEIANRKETASRIPLGIGELGLWMDDPNGNDEIGLTRTGQDIDEADRRRGVLSTRSDFSRQLADRSQISSALPGYARQSEEIQTAQQDRNRRIGAASNKVTTDSEDIYNKDVVRANADYDRNDPTYLSAWNPGAWSDEYELDLKRDAALKRASGDRDARNRVASAQQRMDQARSDAETKNAQRDLDRQIDNQVGGYQTTGERAAANIPQFNHPLQLAAYDRETDRQSRIVYDEGGDRGTETAFAYRRSRDQEREANEAEYRRQQEGVRIGLIGEIGSSGLRSGGNPFLGRINDINTAYLKSLNDNRNPANVPLFQSLAASQRGEAVVDAARNFVGGQIQLQGSIDSSQSLLNRQPLQARYSAITSGSQQALLEAAQLPPELQTARTQLIRQQYAQQGALARQQDADSIAGARGNIRADISTLDILNGPGSLATRTREADIDRIYNRTRLEFDASKRAGTVDRLGPEIRRRGTGQLDDYRRSFYDRLQGDEVDPTRTALTGGNTLDIGAAFADLSRDRKNLDSGKIDASDLTGTTADNSGPAIKALADAAPQIVTAFNSLASALANFVAKAGR